MFNRAPVAFLWTRMSLDLARRVNGPNAPDLAILALLSSCVARLVIHPTALHCTSTFGDIICRMRGVSPPRRTIATLFSAGQLLESAMCAWCGQSLLLTAKFPSAALAARCTSISGLCSRNRMGSSVSRSTSRTSVCASARKSTTRPVKGKRGYGLGQPSYAAKSICPASSPEEDIQTSFSDLGEGQARAPLEVNIVGEDQSAESSQRFPGKEVGLAAL